MPISNGANSFSVGRDCTLILQTQLGRVQLDNVTGFQCAQTTAQVKVDRLDGEQLHADLPKGWNGSFDLERGNSTVEDFFASAEAAWHTGGVYTVATIYQQIIEPNGSASTYQFDNASLKFDNAGTWSGDKSTKQKISFMANRRRRL